MPKAKALGLIAKGAEELPMQWVEVDRNEKLRTESNPLPPEMRSRLVARGDLETTLKRTDSPTVSEEGVFIICSWCVSVGIEVHSADLESGYFQGVKLWYTLVLQQPDGGLPDDSIAHDDYLLANVPIYGTSAAGRGLYFRLRTLFLQHGLRENFVVAALYSYSADGEVWIMIGTHVDDLLLSLIHI